MSEPINPKINVNSLPHANDIARKAGNNMPASFPNVNDAVVDYQSSVYLVVEQISIEYQRMFANEEDSMAGGVTANSFSKGGT